MGFGFCWCFLYVDIDGLADSGVPIQTKTCSEINTHEHAVSIVNDAVPFNRWKQSKILLTGFKFYIILWSFQNIAIYTVAGNNLLN